MKDDEKLIPELREWRGKNSDNFLMQDWIAIEGNIQLAIGYSELFWPEFLEHNGCVFLKSHFSLDTYTHWENTSQNYAQLELVINHVHVVDLFTTASSKQSVLNKVFNKQPKATTETSHINQEQVVFLGNKLREMYRAKLAHQFPDKEFDVSFDYINNPDHLEDYQLTFHQPSNESRLINWLVKKFSTSSSDEN